MPILRDDKLLVWGCAIGNTKMSNNIIKGDFINKSFYLKTCCRQPNGPALSCGVDNFRNATNETSSR
jgi:hypothetical protein